ncbi:MAG: cell division protein SepF [Lachnospiraceae bacterium]|nr:cell division protein SepF [Lachnospiraceae bacterium]
MGLVDKILDVMKLDPDDDFGYDDEFEVENDNSSVAKVLKKKEKVEDVEEEEEPKKSFASKAASFKNVSKITPIKQNKSYAGNASTEMEVCVIRPQKIEDEREITDTLLEGRTVVLNVEGLAVDVAQRIIDFISGSCYAMNGNLQKISNYIFIVTPANVDISGDFQGFMNGYDSNSFRSEF